MDKQYKHSAGFGTVELIIVTLVIGALFGVGGYVWSKNASQRTTNAKTSSPITSANQDQSPTKPDPFGDWRTYTNNELGFTFRYPKEWGTAKVSREAFYDAKYETNLPYAIKFSDTEAPQAWIFPNDWKTNLPYPVDWTRPLKKERLLGDGALQIAQDQTKVASIFFSPAGGGIRLWGVKPEVMPKINANQIDFMQGEAYAEGKPLAPKESCLTQKANSTGSPQGYPTLDCYPEAYRNNFVKFIDSFTAV